MAMANAAKAMRVPRRTALAASLPLPLLLTRRARAATLTAASQAAEVLRAPGFPDTWPYRAQDFQRYDETRDALFYDAPRFVTHIDDRAIESLRQFYERALPQSPDAAVLDICSSWISHYPDNLQAERVAGLGMNEEELRRNRVLTDYEVKDLNLDPKLPYADESFDAVTCAVSVDYLTRPLEVFQEINRVLKPGGVAIMSFSNRCFPTKAISVWTSTGDMDHIWIVGSYFHFAGGFEPPQAEDITQQTMPWQMTDPMYVVYANKEK